MSRNATVLFCDMEEACGKIASFVAGRERDEVFGDSLCRDAVLYNLLVIGEAVKRLPEATRKAHSDIPWREIAGLRDVVAHAYFALDDEILWDAIQTDLPALRSRLRHLLAAGTPPGSSTPSL